MKDSQKNITLTFETTSGLEPWTPPFPPRWVGSPLTPEVKKVYDNVGSYPAEGSKEDKDAWRDRYDDFLRVEREEIALMPMDALDKAWTDIPHVHDELRAGLNHPLPIELQGILEEIIEKGPHRVTYPRAHLEILGDILQPLAENIADRSKDYELNVFCALLHGVVE